MYKLDKKEFDLNEQKRQKIADCFSVKKDMVKKLENYYDKIRKGMKKQYLAHIIRTMEIELQELTGNPMFKIIVDPLPISDANFPARAQYQKNNFFWIGYPEHMDDIHLRVCLAHELGHLYLIEYLNNIDKTANYTEKTKTEPLSSIFGIMAILDKNKFYANLDEKKLLHQTWKDVVKDFKLLENRNKDIYNKS